MLNAEEFDAINTILDALAPLSSDTQQRVMLYVLGRIGAEAFLSKENVRREKPVEDIPTKDRQIQDVRALKDAKSPRSATEMAVLVAYYLSDLAPEGERKKEIQASDLEKYFKQAQYPLPGVLANTLPHAAQAGYLDVASRGRYRLNPVGHNLVVHSLPASGAKAKPQGAKKRAPGVRRSPTKKAVGRSANRASTAPAKPRRAK